VAYVLHKPNRKLSLPGLRVGSMFPDLEKPIIILLLGYQVPYRLLLHSLLGVLTIGTFFPQCLRYHFTRNLFVISLQLINLRRERNADLLLGLFFRAF
jgi:hypothetical protein